MAKAKTRDLREMAADVIQTKVNELEANLFNLRFQASMGKLENTSLLQTSRRDIARAKTVLQQKATANRKGS
jgi:large subunit ribosomal protein L29